MWYYAVTLSWATLLYQVSVMQYNTRGFGENELWLQVSVIGGFIVFFLILTTISFKTVTSVWALIKRVVKPNEQGGKS